jgi:hypothetical protein
MTVSALLSPSCNESHFLPSENMTVKSFFGETVTASSLISHIEEVRTVVMNYCISQYVRHIFTPAKMALKVTMYLPWFRKNNS